MKTLSESKLRANRANALKSTGPRSPEGKARSSQNALTHGLTASADTLSRLGRDQAARGGSRLGRDQTARGGLTSRDLTALGEYRNQFPVALHALLNVGPLLLAMGLASMAVVQLLFILAIILVLFLFDRLRRSVMQDPTAPNMAQEVVYFRRDQSSDH